MMATETMMFIEEVVFKQNGDLATLLTAPYTFVNAALAPFYGVAGQFGDEFVKVDLDPSQRAGVLTQIGFLASNAGAFENDPIHRGVFMNLQLLCTGLPPPPNMVPPLPPPVDGESLRERITRHTGKGTCGEGCHGTLINPLGFAFENYDPLGRWQTMDAGKPVNAADEFYFTDAVAVSPRAMSSGVPSATTRPPARPPPGPSSRIQSAALSTDGWCSITTSESPRSTSCCITVINRITSDT